VADVVIVGAGLAGARTCALLRSSGVTGRIVLIGAETHPPYDRPPLSKDPDAEVDLRPAMGVDVWAHADDIRLGTRAEGLAVSSSPGGALAVVCSDGSRLPAHAVVVATGATPVRPAHWDQAGSYVLHDRPEAAQFWAAVRPGVRLVVVGGGWIGCEAVATAAGRGAHVALLEAQGTLLEGRVPPEVAHRVAGWLAGTGVELQLGSAARGIEQTADGPVVEGLPADLVLVALGVRPETAWLSGSGVELGACGAVLVDQWGRSSTRGVFAVGDAASRWSPRYGAHLPGGHWTQALNAPETLAPAVAQWVEAESTAQSSTAHSWGEPPDLPAADPIPYVFSDVGERTLLVLGSTARGRVVWREEGQGIDQDSKAWTAFTLDGQDRLLGMCTSGRPRDLAVARRAMLADPRGTPRTDPAALADPGSTSAAMFPGEG
jgi:3-phenylpropionate/trans-cinnamate dioxygenase ferredoxin reductase subunit